jgi:hypothetical protein
MLHTESMKQMLTLLLFISLFAPFALAQGPPSFPAAPDLTLQPSPPEAAPMMPVGVSQPNVDFKNEIEQRNDADRRDDESRRNAALGPAATHIRTTQETRFHLAKMERGPAYARDAWQKGRWVHGKHDGSFAWWWVVDANWFRYDKRVMPYPNHDTRQVYIPRGTASRH